MCEWYFNKGFFKRHMSIWVQCPQSNRTHKKNFSQASMPGKAALYTEQNHVYFVDPKKEDTHQEGLLVVNGAQI